MRKIFFILFVFAAFICNAQLSSITLRNDTLFSVNPSTGVWTQLTKTVPPKTGQNGKVLSTDGTDYTWITPFDGNYNSLTNKPTVPTNTNQLTNGSGYLVAADIAGKQNTITTGTTAQYFKGDLSLGTYTGYSINVQALTSSPTDAQTVYFGTLPKAPTTTANISKVYVRQAGTITAAEIYCYSGTAGTNEAWSLYIRLNNTTDYLIQTVSAATSERVFTNSSLSISLNANDYFEIKGVQPTWATNPLTTIYGGYVRIN